MSVNIVDENLGLHQVAGNVSPDRVALIEQLAAQAAEHARLAQESAAAAQELAQGAEEKVRNIKSESFTLTNVNGWKRVLEFTGNSLALNFALSAVDAMAAVSGVLNAALNTTCLVSQLSSRDIDRLHKIDKVGVLFRGDRTCFYIHTPKNIAKIQLVITGSYQEAVYQNEDEELPDGAYIYDFAIDSGIIADKAMTVNPEVFKKHEVVSNYRVTTNDEIQNAIDDAYNNAPNNSYFEFIISVNEPGLVLGGGVWYFKGFRNVDVWGWVEGKTYWLNQPKYKRNKMDGEWRDWVVESFSRNTVTTYEYTSNVDIINNWLNSIHENAPDHGHYEGAIGISTSSFDIPGGLYYVTGYRYTLNDGSFQEAKSYVTDSNGGCRHYIRSRHGGTWTPWRNMSVIDNLVQHPIKSSYIVRTQEEWDNTINTIYDAVNDDSAFEAVVSVGVSDISMEGGMWYISGFKHNDSFGYYEAKKYGTSSNKKMFHKVQSKQNGDWGALITVNY